LNKYLISNSPVSLVSCTQKRIYLFYTVSVLGLLAIKLSEQEVAEMEGAAIVFRAQT
jgi:hypothetical protein